jgi:hypothetical protein
MRLSRGVVQGLVPWGRGDLQLALLDSVSGNGE